ncbi:MAG: hypothetical protein Q8R00_04315, partial [Candidatus Nanoarchaeia archaeon]|nr:hypothetical protein [Candidatus Nanoarchaeia archaeon]
MANIALCYDADYTLLRDYHPRLIFERRNLDFDNFLNRVRELEAKEKTKGENTRLDIVYLAQFMYEVRHGSLQGLTIQEIRGAGKDLDKMLYPGLPEFFNKIKETNPQHTISHHIISVGLKDLLEASILGKYADSIFGYTF